MGKRYKKITEFESQGKESGFTPIIYKNKNGARVVDWKGTVDEFTDQTIADCEGKRDNYNNPGECELDIANEDMPDFCVYGNRQCISKSVKKKIKERVKDNSEEVNDEYEAYLASMAGEDPDSIKPKRKSKNRNNNTGDNNMLVRHAFLYRENKKGKLELYAPLNLEKSLYANELKQLKNNFRKVKARTRYKDALMSLYIQKDGTGKRALNFLNKIKATNINLPKVFSSKEPPKKKNATVSKKKKSATKKKTSPSKKKVATRKKKAPVAKKKVSTVKRQVVSNSGLQALNKKINTIGTRVNALGKQVNKNTKQIADNEEKLSYLISINEPESVLDDKDLQEYYSSFEPDEYI